MPDIFSDAWLAEWTQLINSDPDVTAMAPEGLWRMHVVIEGDENSPYVSAGERIELMFHLEDRRCTRLERITEAPGPRDLDFRFTGPAPVFEQIAAGLLDPVDAGLQGQIRIAGDMRFLLRYAELTTRMMDLYMTDLKTEWPQGKPPYAGSEESS